jgi:hypothetical protein
MTDNDRYYALLSEPFWLLGGILWLLAVLRHRTARLSTGVPSQKSSTWTLWNEIPDDPALKSSTWTHLEPKQRASESELANHR